MTVARITDLSGIEMISGLTEERKPFVSITATDSAGNRMIGQLPPAEIRAHAMGYLEAAEAAEMDAMVAAFLVETLGLSFDDAAQTVGGLRAFREQQR